MSLHEEDVLGKAYDARLMRRLLGYLRPYRRNVILASAAIVGHSVVELAPPLLTKLVLDRYIESIDGTRSFVRGVPLWATLVGLEYNGEQIAGVAELPALGLTYRALRGDGAFRGEKRLRVSEVGSLAEAVMGTVPGMAGAPPWVQLVVLLPLLGVLSLAAALVLHLAVEKPFLLLKERVRL